MILSGAYRSFFWYLAYPEIKPTRAFLKMEYFPAALVAANVALAVLPLVTAILVYTPAPQETKTVQPADIAPAGTTNTAPISGLPNIPAPPDSGCRSFAPASAVYEEN